MKSSWFILLLLFIASAQAQTYKWVDASGRVTYSDQPPPASFNAQKKPLAGTEESSGGLPYVLLQAVKSNPVTLYTASSCAPCDDGRALLRSRGIPFTEKTVASSADMARMAQAGGDGRLPFMTVGRNPQTGFDASSWDAALTAAGYPETSQLPANYRHVPATPAAPAGKSPEKTAQPKEPAEPAPPRLPNRLPPTKGDVPPGFRF